MRKWTPDEIVDVLEAATMFVFFVGIVATLILVAVLS